MSSNPSFINILFRGLIPSLLLCSCTKVVLGDDEEPPVPPVVVDPVAPPDDGDDDEKLPDTTGYSIILNDDGRLSSVSSATVQSTFTYNGRGQLTSILTTYVNADGTQTKYRQTYQNAEKNNPKGIITPPTLPHYDGISPLAEFARHGLLGIGSASFPIGQKVFLQNNDGTETLICDFVFSYWKVDEQEGLIYWLEEEHIEGTTANRTYRYK